MTGDFVRRLCSKSTGSGAVSSLCPIGNLAMNSCSKRVGPVNGSSRCLLRLAFLDLGDDGLYNVGDPGEGVPNSVRPMLDRNESRGFSLVTGVLGPKKACGNLESDGDTGENS